VHRKSHRAYEECGKYMREMVTAKKNAVHSGTDEATNIDLIGQLVQERQEEGKDGKSKGVAALSESEVIGNLFIFYIAGHETSANSIHFSLLLLALHPIVQANVQEELDRIFRGRPISEWEYDRDLPSLLGGILGAVLNEELRLITPVMAVPKTTGFVPQQLTINGKDVTLPANMIMKLSVHAVHRNPKFWPHGPPKDAEKPYFPPGNVSNDLEEFKPERWIKKKEAPQKLVKEALRGNPENLAIDTTANTSASLYTPVKGSYLPFSDGPRACLGRRFAQVEILAALAVILTQHTVELAVDEWASDQNVEDMSKEQKKETWKKAEEKANSIWQNKMLCIFTLQIRGAHVPMRFVRRGKERFRDL